MEILKTNCNRLDTSTRRLDIWRHSDDAIKIATSDRLAAIGHVNLLATLVGCVAQIIFQYSII